MFVVVYRAIAVLRYHISERPSRPSGDGNAVDQLKNACSLPVVVAGALMPDAHQGYGLPIGGVLATKEAVIPYAVGVDIACRMKMTVLDLPIEALERDQKRLPVRSKPRRGLAWEPEFQTRRRHEVMDADWRVTPLTVGLKDRAWAQLGTSGSGNHLSRSVVWS
jgi:tRNA-splicing ligase RtcB